MESRLAANAYGGKIVFGRIISGIIRDGWIIKIVFFYGTLKKLIIRDK